MTVVIIIVIFLFAGIFAVNSLGRTAQKAKGQAKCTFCGKRLKKVGPGYADHCHACGRAQPWAKTS